MFSKSLVASLTLVALASPTFSAPIPNAHAELEARLSLPSGAIGGLIKSLGSGILTSGVCAATELSEHLS
jgi:predicted dinucleotide-utilizing enzyme